MSLVLEFVPTFLHLCRRLEQSDCLGKIIGNMGFKWHPKCNSNLSVHHRRLVIHLKITINTEYSSQNIPHGSLSLFYHEKSIGTVHCQLYLKCAISIIPPHAKYVFYFLCDNHAFAIQHS